nr:hypothetical protein [Candidatus Freyrarchaeum guaymaensis]
MKVCVCTVCNSYFSSKAKRPKCPRCGGWGKKVCEVENAREAAEKVRLLQAQRVDGEKGFAAPTSTGGTRSGSDFSCSVRATFKQRETIGILGMHGRLGEERGRRPNGLTSFMSFVSMMGGVVSEEDLFDVFDRNVIEPLIERLEAQGRVVKVGGKLVFKDV